MARKLRNFQRLQMKRSYFLSLMIAVCAALILVACGGSKDATISGTVSGLLTGQSVTLQNNFKDASTVSANGPFTFSQQISPYNAYYVTVLTQPLTGQCTVSKGIGAVDTQGTPVNDVAVTCVEAYTIGGSITGLATGNTVVISLAVNSTTTQTLTLLPTTTTWAFSGTQVLSTPYAVSITTQPTGQTCTLTNDTGTVNATTPTAVVITCV